MEGTPAPRGAPDVRTSALALAVALAMHSAATIALLQVEPRWEQAADHPVEFDVAPPPPPKEEVPPPPEPPPEPARPVVATRKVPAPEPRRYEPPLRSPPPPNQEAPTNAPTNAPPVFGVTMSSVVSGEAAMAVPVGNTTMTKARTPPTTTAPAPYRVGDTRTFTPEPDIYIHTRPRVLREVNSADIYPADAKALGIEATVKLSVGIDERGKVVEVRVIRSGGGHGFDDKAVQAMKKTLFSPALTSDGRAVPCRITYDYTFEIDE